MVDHVNSWSSWQQYYYLHMFTTDADDVLLPNKDYTQHQVHVRRILLQMCLLTGLLPYTLGLHHVLLGHLFLTSDEIPADGTRGSGGVPVVAEQSSAPP